MKKYRGIVREVYEYELDVYSEDKETAIKKLKDYYQNGNTYGVFVADGCTYSKTEFKVRKRTSTDYEVKGEHIVI